MTAWRGIRFWRRLCQGSVILGFALIPLLNIKDITLNSLRSHIGVVQQDVYLFSGTVYDNIIYGKQKAPLKSGAFQLHTNSAVNLAQAMGQAVEQWQNQQRQRG